MRSSLLTSSGALLLLVGCPTPRDATPVEPSTPPPSSCSELPATPPLAVCAAPEGGWAPEEAPAFGGSFQLSLNGPVLDAGSGEVPDGCFDNDYLGVLGEEERGWFRVADASGVTWTVGVSGLPSSVEPGDDVNASFLWTGEFQWQNEEGVFTLRDADDALLTWISLGGTLAGLTPPSDFTLVEGEAVCSLDPATGVCPARVAFDVVLDAAPVLYGETTTVADWTVVHAGYARAWDTDVEGCEWYADPIYWLIGVSSL